MNVPDRDERLRAAFARLRTEVEPRVPDAARLLASPRPAGRRGARRRIALSAALGVVVTIALAMLRGERSMPPGAGSEDVARARATALEGYPWRSPTDFLLELPGAELGRTTPSFDATSTLLPAIELRPRERADGHRGGRNTR